MNRNYLDQHEEWEKQARIAPYLLDSSISRISAHMYNTQLYDDARNAASQTPTAPSYSR
jgi:hypothetical protein